MKAVASFCVLLPFVLLPFAVAADELTITEYAHECAERIAEVPAFDCTDGVVAAVTVNGKEPEKYVPHMKCDWPALLPYDGKGDPNQGQCIPYSRALVLRDDAEFQISAFCRMKRIRAAESTSYDEIDVILHSRVNGSTCWFQATALAHGKESLDGRRVPSPSGTPGYPPPESFWNTPAQIAAFKCGTCHDSDPFYYSPYVAQTGQLPLDPFGPYANDVGKPFQEWPKPSAISTRGNTCTGCHRIGSLQTCSTGIWQAVGSHRDPVKDLDAWGQRYPHSHWMPVGNQWTKEQWEVIYRDSLESLARCCEDHKAPDCEVTQITGNPPGQGHN